MSACGTKRTFARRQECPLSGVKGTAHVARRLPTFLTLTTVAKSLSMMTRGDDGVTEKIHFILRLLKTQRQRIA